MPMIKKTVTVTEQQESWIKDQIQSGTYGNDSEYVSDLIRRDQARQHSRLEALRTALVQGEASGEPKPFQASEFKRELKRKHGRDRR